MSRIIATAASSVAMAVSAVVCFDAVWNGINMLPATGMFLCTIVIFLANLAASKKENK